MLLTWAHTLDGGDRVRLRLPIVADRPRLLALHERLGVPVDEVEVARLVRFDPRFRVAICAAGWTSAGPVLLGFGAIDLHRGATPDIVLADEETAPGVGALLRAALAERVQRGQNVA